MFRMRSRVPQPLRSLRRTLPGVDVVAKFHDCGAKIPGASARIKRAKAEGITWGELNHQGRGRQGAAGRVLAGIWDFLFGSAIHAAGTLLFVVLALVVAGMCGVRLQAPG